MTEGPKINPGDIILWPMLKIAYDTKPEKIKALLPPGIETSDTSQVHLTTYCFPVPDVPEYGLLLTVELLKLELEPREILTLAPLAALAVALGLCPDLVLDIGRVADLVVELLQQERRANSCQQAQYNSQNNGA